MSLLEYRYLALAEMCPEVWKCPKKFSLEQNNEENSLQFLQIKLKLVMYLLFSMNILSNNIAIDSVNIKIYIQFVKNGV